MERQMFSPGRSPKNISKMVSPKKSFFDRRQSNTSNQTCQRCYVRNLLSQSSEQRQHSKKSRSKSTNRRETLTSLEKIRRTSELTKHNISNQKNSVNNSKEKSIRKAEQQTQKKPMPQEPVHKPSKHTIAYQKKCMELIRKRRQLQIKQKQRLNAAIKIQAAWRGYLARRKLRQQYESLLKQEESFQQQSIIDGIRDSLPQQSKLRRPSSPEKELEAVLELKQELQRQMHDIGMLRERLERKDQERQNYYRTVVKELEEKLEKAEKGKNESSIDDEEKGRRNRLKNKVRMMLQAIIEQRVEQQLTGDNPSYCNMLAIRRYIHQLQEHLQAQHKEQLERNVNTTFGFSYIRRLALLHQESEEHCHDYSKEILHFVMPEDIFDEVEESFTDKEGRHFRRAIFDCFNESLAKLRPYFKQSSQPYPWSPVKKHHTHKIHEILSICGKDMEKNSSLLTGLIVNMDPTLQSQLEQQNKEWKLEVFEKRQEKSIMEMMQLWIEETPSWYYRQDERTEVTIEVAEWVLEYLVYDFGSWLTKINTIRSLRL